MKTQDSIHTLGTSFDVYECNIAEVISIVKKEMTEKFNTNLEPYVRELKKTTIEETEYWLYESYFDSGSNYYYFFSIRR